ncbi:hypothetical protein ACGFU4_33390 [Streptomyces sp. NPDC048511]|uniref:hypothetical protein n=1 Tax=Streptomyces sp. NPDC048511 TaxID=3365562 RepID=UPI00370FED8B
MFDREIRVLSARPLADTQLRFWVNGEDLIDAAFGEGGRGPYAADALSAGSLSSFQATGGARRLELGEPHCTGGCCGFLAVVVQRVGEIVQWSDWEIPWGASALALQLPPELRFDASRYDAEVARAEAARW